MAWNDYFEPDFDDPDSPSYAGDGYLPVFGEKYRGTPGFVGTFEEEITKTPFFDIKDQKMVVMAVMKQKSIYDIMREAAIKTMRLLEEDPTYDIWGTSVDTTPESHYEPPEEVPYDPATDARCYDRGKYKGQRVMDVYKSDRSYYNWSVDTILDHAK